MNSTVPDERYNESIFNSLKESQDEMLYILS